MSMYSTIARAPATAHGGGAARPAAAAQPLVGSEDGAQWRAASSGATDQFTACRTVGAPISLERFLCYRAVANLTNEPRIPSPPPTRPIAIDRTGIHWAD
jgi:hypothetical protein